MVVDIYRAVKQAGKCLLLSLVRNSMTVQLCLFDCLVLPYHFQTRQTAHAKITFHIPVWHMLLRKKNEVNECVL